MPDNSTRTHEFIASFQIDGVCGALQELVPHGIEPGPDLRAMLQSLRDDFVGRCKGRSIDLIPPVTDSTSGVDLLAIAEVLRATNIAFLTPDEQQERRRFDFKQKVYDNAINNFPPQQLPTGDWILTRHDARFNVSVLIGGRESIAEWQSFSIVGRRDVPGFSPDEPILCGADGVDSSNWTLPSPSNKSRNGKHLGVGAGSAASLAISR